MWCQNDNTTENNNTNYKYTYASLLLETVQKAALSDTSFYNDIDILKKQFPYPMDEPNSGTTGKNCRLLKTLL